jgi:PAS domain S-box-containing protein
MSTNPAMSISQTETADYSASLLTRLYVFALSGIAALLIGGQFIVQQSIFKNSGDARIINMAGRQRSFSQRLAKCALAIDYAVNAQTAARYTQELDLAVKQCTLEHESLQIGSDNVVVTQQYSPQMHLLFSKLEPPYQTMIKNARALIARQRAEPFDGAHERSISRYTEKILAEEPIVLDGLENILSEIVQECNRQSDDLAQTEISLLLATLLCLLLLGFVIFRPAIEQIRTIIRAMEKMQNRLDATISSMGEGLFQVDKTGSIGFANATFEKLVGYSFIEINGKSIHEILHHVDTNHPRECSFVNATNFNNEVQITDDVFRHKDGTYFPVQMVSSPIMRRGERVGAVITFRDVTERNLLERRLNAQHAITLILQDADSVDQALPKILATLCQCFDVEAGAVWFINPLKSALECVLVQHPPGNEFDELDQVCKDHVFMMNEGLPGRVWKLKDALYIHNIAEKADLVMRTSQLAKAKLKSAFAFPIIQSQKVLGVIEFFGKELREPDEQLLTLVASTSNQIGEFVQRKRTEMHLVSSEATLNAIINSMAEGVIVADLTGKFLLTNQAAKRMHNTPVAENNVTDWTKLFTYYGADMRSPLRYEDLPLVRALRGESVDNMELFLQPISGKEGVWLSATARLLGDENGDLIGGVVVMNDVTERKRTEQRLSEFYSTVSHELRTPLTSIKAALGLLEGGIAGDLSTKAMQLVSVGRAESDRLVRLINDILDVKKMEDGKFELQVVEVDLAELIEKSVTGLDAIIAQSDLTIDISLDAPAIVMGDRDRLTQVLYNLISNAIKFSPKGSTIKISVAHEHDFMKISIADQGQGIPADQMHLLFEMFQQLSVGENRPPGTGLGLAICKKIVELHEGRIGLESKVGEGSVFWFELPVRKPSKVSS